MSFVKYKRFQSSSVMSSKPADPKTKLLCATSKQKAKTKNKRMKSWIDKGHERQTISRGLRGLSGFFYHADRMACEGLLLLFSSFRLVPVLRKNFAFAQIHRTNFGGDPIQFFWYWEKRSNLYSIDVRMLV